MLSSGLDPAEQSGISMLSSKAQTELFAFSFHVFKLFVYAEAYFQAAETYKDVQFLFLAHASLTYFSLLVCLDEL